MVKKVSKCSFFLSTPPSHENMSKIQEVHKKKNSWNPQNDLVNNFTPEERVKNCEKLIEELSTTYKLDNLKNIKVVKEFEGVGLRKKMQDAEKVNDKESNLLRVPVAAMLTSDSECNGKEFEKFIGGLIWILCLLRFYDHTIHIN